MIRVVWWEEWLWRKDCYWCQATTVMCMVAATNAYLLKMYCCWSYLLICIVVDHDVNFAASIHAFLVVLTRFATFLLQVCIISYVFSHKLRNNTQLVEGVDSAGAAWQSRLLRMEWSGLFGGRNDCGGKTATGVRLLQRCEWLQQPDHLRYITMQV